MEPQLSLRQQQARLTARLRAEGMTWVRIAEVYRDRFRVNPRAALRMVRGWSQQRAADAWNQRWPDHPKTLKNFSYWENWPNPGGHAPTHEHLAMLAELYECSVGDLLADLPDFRHLDQAATANLAVPRDTPAAVTGEIIVPSNAENLLLDLLSRQPGTDPSQPLPASLGELFRRSEEVDFGELAKVIIMWTQHIPHLPGRREIFGKLAAALTVAATAPLTDLDGMVASAREGRFDLLTLEHCETVVPNMRRQGDVLGALSTLPSVLAYRSIAEQQAEAAPPAYRDRAVAAYAELTQLTGWLCFNAGDYKAAQRYYDEARTAAHEARAVELVTYILCAMSHLATWQGKPRIGIDHAAAAAFWAEQTGSAHARAYAADVAVRALLADGRPEQCDPYLSREHEALIGYDKNSEPRKSWWYFFDESFYWRTNAEHALKLRRPDEAMAAADRSLELSDMANLHNRAFRMLFRAEAFVQQDRIEFAVEAIEQVVILTALNTTKRLDQRVTHLRSSLDPWRRTRAVKHLDQVINAYAMAVPGRSGRTNRTYSV
ncbi:tetratricopeptide (TPR) repeat protein [Allocatelliglobosispora scoriae]|uniref:Tetratricopeptide (TPR) repeat protein n=1 Tax=Allocatelliglobosispora scoriae TaxID=643052 RepID=A0A841BM01_9ACTN|nr:hypothetical protein [Allocatelliglobosispora scoriae]MBB5867891.1 tetratricopeptide (TPR) repeat protein [Allocatelliglobosispora scoriae]